MREKVLTEIKSTLIAAGIGLIGVTIYFIKDYLSTLLSQMLG